MNRLIAPLTIAAAALLAAATAHAQLAGRTVSIIVPQPAGNPTDGVARKLQPLLQKELDLTVIVENTPGAGGSIGAQKVLSGQANTVSVLIASQTEPILTPFTIKGARYKPEDFRAIALVARLPYILVARPGLAAGSPVELAALAKKSATPLSFGNIGPGSMIHLLGEQWARKSGVKLNQISYRGVPPVTQDLMGDQIDLSFLPLGGATLSMIQSGKVKAIASSAATAHPQLPRLPTIAASDKSLADFVYGTWIALLVPTKTPADVVERLNKALTTAMKDSDFQAYVASSGMELATGNTLRELDKFYAAETQLYQGLAKDIGVTAE
ncbi:tripartite tricarboxylate transporter substrate binding protein [Acidovorax sp. A1169]|uniref:tripartite tricarboxylate transporter substrate binding protein n=1 Tax=Acidovorax sp. A1169 TaxID=3059524 RepID=UPI002737E802|nr:tripartite tricarboxylate transporter substrate binding protein [Acidovorax sp. A1169]MDP4078541.1 tripartite tricarboxylate transporter substrate binding protein [Acidovorax sp. A1169]